MKNGSFLNVVEQLAQQRASPFLTCSLVEPFPRAKNFSFHVPQKWAATVIPRISSWYPHLVLTSPSLYLQSFIHETFVRGDSQRECTMHSLVPLGDTILTLVLRHWITRVLPNLHGNDVVDTALMFNAVQPLAFVCSPKVWGLSDLILNDEGLSAIKNPVKMAHTRVVPQDQAAGAVKALIAAVYLNAGMPSSVQFVQKHVVPGVLSFHSH